MSDHPDDLGVARESVGDVHSLLGVALVVLGTQNELVAFGLDVLAGVGLLERKLHCALHSQTVHCVVASERGRETKLDLRDLGGIGLGGRIVLGGTTGDCESEGECARKKERGELASLVGHRCSSRLSISPEGDLLMNGISQFMWCTTRLGPVAYTDMGTIGGYSALREQLDGRRIQLMFDRVDLGLEHLECVPRLH